MPLREVKNAQGDIAMFDDETGNIMPTRPKTAAEAPVVSQTQLKQVRNAQGQTALFDPDTGALFPQQQVTEDMQKTQQHLEATKPQRGTDLTPTPIQPKEPLFMEKYIPRPPGSEITDKLSWPIANFIVGMTPVGRVAKAGIGAGMSALEDISHGQAPSIPGMAIGAASSFVPEGVVQGGKWALRQGAKLLGKTPLVKGAESAAANILKAPTVKAASETFEAVKGSQQSLNGAGDEFRQLAGDLLRKEGRAGVSKEVSNVVSDELTAITNARLSGKPLNYGEVFQRARAISEKALNATGSDRVQLFKIHDSLINDLSKVGPEAAQAVQGYRLAKTAERVTNAVKTGSVEGVTKVLEKSGEQFTPQQAKDLITITGNLGRVNSGSWKQIVSQLGLSGVIGTASVPGGIATLAPGLIASALVRLPGGAGVAVARSLVSPEGEVSKLVLPAVGMAVRSMMKEGTNGNN